MLQKMESEKRNGKRLELVREEALEVKEQRHVITELKQQIRTQEVWEKKLKKEEVRGQEKEVNEKIEKRKEEIIKQIHQQQQVKLSEEVAEVERRQRHIEQMEKIEN
jgi:hypothetical protein